VRFSATLRVADGGVVKVGACHCAMCRRWGSGPYIGIAAKGPVAYEGEDQIALYQGSDWAERGFCRTCGSHLFWRMRTNSLSVLSAGAFDDTTGFTLDNEIYVDCASGFYAFAGERTRMTEAEAKAAFAPGA
jgi:hypothetical protein